MRFMEMLFSHWKKWQLPYISFTVFLFRICSFFITTVHAVCYPSVKYLVMSLAHYFIQLFVLDISLSLAFIAFTFSATIMVLLVPVLVICLVPHELIVLLEPMPSVFQPLKSSTLFFVACSFVTTFPFVQVCANLHFLQSFILGCTRCYPHSMIDLYELFSLVVSENIGIMI